MPAGKKNAVIPEKNRRAWGEWQVHAFEVFWDHYPRHLAKAAARKAWQRLQPDYPLVQRMLDAIAQQRKSLQWQRGYIPHPATWLNGERWDDELTADDFVKVKL